MGDRYTIERPLGRGGMATVFLAAEQHPSRRVAVKVLDPELSDRLGRERFLREIEIVSRLTHPHIVPVFAAGEAGGLLYYVMPYIEGQSLRQRLLAERRLPLGDALHVAADVADALAHAHAHGVIHRDVKPENVLLSGGHALVADFGIARAVRAASEALTVAGLPLGTPGYMSPEQATGSTHVDARTDIYSLACVVHECLYGEAPGPLSPRRATGADRSRAPGGDATAATIPATVQEALARALAWDPAERFPTMTDFARALAVSPHHGTAAATPTPPRQVSSRSIAVLPFASLSAEPDNEYFADGITDEIITHLSKIGALKVTSRTSVMRYKRGERSLQQIGAELGVATVLEGSVRRSGNRVRISAQLVDVTSDGHLWAETYDRDLTDIFAIQSDVAEQIAAALRTTLSPDEQARIEKKPTRNMEAYSDYLRGIHYFNRFTLAGTLRAIECFGKAIERDPGFALAYLGLARVYLVLGIAGGPVPPGEAFRSAKEAAERALELDDGARDAHGVLGAIHTWWDWDWDAAEAQFLKANVTCAECEKPYVEYGYYLAARGRHREAVRYARRALELDPVSLMVNTHVAHQWYWWRRFDRARDQLAKTLELDASFPPALCLAGWLDLLEGRPEDAEPLFRQALAQAGPTTAVRAALACSQAAAGREDEARDALRVLELPVKGEFVSPRDVALVHTWLGQPRDALIWLDRAVEEHAPWTGFLKVDPIWDALREESPFQELVARMGLA